MLIAITHTCYMLRNYYGTASTGATPTVPTNSKTTDNLHINTDLKNGDIFLNGTVEQNSTYLPPGKGLAT